MYNVINDNVAIETKIGLLNIRKLALAKADNRTVYAINIGKEGNTVTTTKMAENVGCRLGMFPVEKDIAVISENNVLRIESKGTRYGFTKAFIVLTFEELGQLHQIMANGIYIHYRGARTKVYYNDAGTMRDLVTNEAADKDVVMKDGKFRRGVRWYIAPDYSPSQQRKTQTLMIDSTEGYEKVARMISMATNGGYDEYAGKVMPYAKMVKAVARMGQWLAPSKDLGEVSDFILCNYEWVDANGDILWDGMSKTRAGFYAEGLSRATGVRVKPAAVVGEMLQIRPWTIKASTLVEDDDAFKLFIKRSMAAGRLVRFKRSELTADVQKKIAEGADGKGELAGKDIWIGDNELPDMIFDRNALKTNFDFQSPGRFNVLDIAKPSPANTSMQMLEKLMYKHRNDTLLLVKDLADEQIIKELVKDVIDRQVKVPEFKDIASLWLNNVAGSIAPEYATKKDKAMFRSILKNLVKRFVNNINKLKFLIDGANLRLISDTAQLHGATNILKFGEVFSKDAEHFFKKSGLPESEWKVTVFKYPTMGMRECYTANVVSSAEIKKRIKALNVDQEIKSVLIKQYMTLSAAVLVLPAIEELKALLAGADFDYDGATVIYNARFNEIIRRGNENPMIVKITEEKVKKEAPEAGSLRDKLHKQVAFKNNESFNKEYVFSVENFAVTFIEQVLSGNKSIGETTNINSIQIYLMYNLAKAKEVFLKAFPEGTKQQYIGLVPEEIEIDGVTCDLYKINAKIVEQLIQEMQSVEFSDENLRKMLFDLNVIYRYYQETIIDAAKTGAKVDVAIEIGKLTWAMSLTDMHGEIKWDEEKFHTYLDGSIAKKKDTFEDSFYKLKARFIMSLRSVIEQDIIPAEQKFNIEELARFQKYANKAHRSLVESLKMVKLLYNDLAAGHAKRMEDSESDDEKEDSRKQFKEDISVLSAFARRLTEDFSPVERARIAKYSSMISSNGIRADGGSQFAALALQEEYLMMLIEDFAEIDFAGQELIANKVYKSGDMVAFTHGIAEHALVEADINGTFEIKEFNGKLYATQKIADMVTIPSAENVAPVKLKQASIKGREREVVEQLDAAKQVFVTANTSVVAGKKVDDYAIYVINENDEIIKVADIDTQGGLYNQMVNGAKATISKIAHNKVRAYRKGNEVESVIVMLKDLEISGDFKGVSFEKQEEVIEIEIEESDDL